VDRAVLNSAGVEAHAASTGHGVRVAIFDTWPLNDPTDPLGRIRAFRDRLRRAGVVNPRLDDAAEGRIVPPERIHDYVSGAPPTVPCVHLLCDHTIEPPYELSSHGLFIADIVNDIAPEAELSVYRVLTDDGACDLMTLARAVQDAVAEADGAPLILNLSLGFAPSLPLVEAFLKQAPQIVKNKDAYLQLVEMLLEGGDRAETRRSAGAKAARLDELIALSDQGLLAGVPEAAERGRPSYLRFA
jgi:hypothetical protein